MTDTSRPWSVPLTARWSLWKDLVLRGTGFPIELLEPLADGAASEVLAGLIVAQDEVAQGFESVRRFLKELTPSEDPAERKLWLRAIQDLEKRKVPRRHPTDPRLLEMLEGLRAARDDLARKETAWKTSFAGLMTASRTHLCRIVERADFREALLGQTPHLASALLSRFPEPARSGKVAEQRRMTVLRYLQRYAAKNDTIGFFGPVGWGSVVEDEPGIRFTPGPGLVTTRHLRFEYWAIDALVEALGRDPALRRWIAPRLHPRVRLVDGKVLRSGRPPVSLPPAVVRLLSQCDGRTPAVEVLRAVAGDPRGPAARRLRATMERLVQRRILVWRIPVPVDPWPELRLRRELAAIPRPPVRKKAVAMLDELEAARGRVAEARGEPEAMGRALHELGTTFTRLTGVAAGRSAGKTYAGRTPLYEDCLRDGRLTVGLDFLKPAVPALDLLFRGASWFLDEAGDRCHAAILRAHRQLRERSGRGDIAYELLMLDARVRGQLAAELELELQARWAGILAGSMDPAGDTRHVIQLTSDALAAKVAAAFPAREPTWPQSRFIAPDLMVAAASPGALQRGEGTVVVGEIHLGSCLLLGGVFHPFHPDPARLDAQYMADRGCPYIHHAHDRRYPAARVLDGLRSPDGLQIDLHDTPPWRPPQQVVAVSELVVREVAGRLVVSTHDGSHTWALMNGIGGQIRHSFANYRPWAPAPHQPRLVLDGVVIAREQWVVPAETLPVRSPPAAMRPEDAQRRWEELMVTVGRWRRQQGMARRVFARIEGERKPFLVDFESPYSVMSFVRMAGKEGGGSVTFSEMLPGAGDCWLTDAAGRRYTSELRLIVVDGRGRAGGLSPGLSPS